MKALKQFLLSPAFVAVLGVICLVSFVLLTARNVWTAVVVLSAFALAGLLTALFIWLRRRWRAKRQGGRIDSLMQDQAREAERRARLSHRAEMAELRKGLQRAIRSLRSVGGGSSREALYRLPWYLVLGHPAAGKSSAILEAGLDFPLDEHSGHAVQGVGGTRHCDWFFTQDGILIDTAGRFSVYREDRREWLGFLDLLRKSRPRAPVNGLIVVVSLPELLADGQQAGAELARQLRQRIQETTDRLEIAAPVYLIFTKADRLPGFRAFFQTFAPADADDIWGATLPYAPAAPEHPAQRFNAQFDVLLSGLRQRAGQRAGDDNAAVGAGFTIEFAALRTPLAAFISTLFEDNPFQHPPVFRGFYFTSATQDAAQSDASSHALDAGSATLRPPAAAETPSHKARPYFLRGLFRNVIFADAGLVAQYSNPRRMRARYAAFAVVLATLGLLFGGWTWSYLHNQRLALSVRADMDRARAAQGNQVDLESRFEAMAILQQRIEQLEDPHRRHPLTQGLGLDQTAPLRQALMEQWFAGARVVMLAPVQQTLEDYLAAVATHDGGWTGPPTTSSASSADERPGTPAPAAMSQAYNGLKTYLMLADRQRADVSHLYDQLARFWRGWLEANRAGMSRESLARSAESVIAFHLSRAGRPDWPEIQPRQSLVDDVRERLGAVMAGLPARDRQYARIKARASTRFPPITVKSLLDQTGEADTLAFTGSHAISGAFSRDAWTVYIADAFEAAAQAPELGQDWVLRRSAAPDTAGAGVPDDLKRYLLQRYQQEYRAEWQTFLRGLSAREYGGFDEALAAMEHQASPRESPLRRLLQGIKSQTDWNSNGNTVPSAPIDAASAGAAHPLVEWFKRVVLRRTPHQLNRASYYADPDIVRSVGATGASEDDASPSQDISKAFSGIDRLLEPAETGSLLEQYLQRIRAVAGRLQQIERAGDRGPGSSLLMTQTLNGQDSELSDALQFVDAELLPALAADQRDLLRPLLLRPLIQVFAALIPSVEGELNQQWKNQVYEKFDRVLAGKYPISPSASIEASPGEISAVYGPSGAIARFANTSLAPFVVRRGDTVVARTWADIGLSLTPAFTRHFAGWISSLGAQGVPDTRTEGASTTVFQILPMPAPEAREFTLEIDGQRLVYRNTPPQWSNFVWPNPAGSPGVTLSATGFDGERIELIDSPGRFGLQKLIESSEHRRLGDNLFELAWEQGGVQVLVQLRIISNPQSGNSAGSIAALQLPREIAGSDDRMAGHY